MLRCYQIIPNNLSDTNQVSNDSASIIDIDVLFCKNIR